MVLVAVQLSVLGLYLPPVLKSVIAISAPDDHFATGPHCRVTNRARGRVDGAGGGPTVGGRDYICRRCSNKVLDHHDSPPQTIISVPVQTAV